jgi:plasmid stability protein
MPKGHDEATRDLLLRGFPAELGDKLKVAAALHGESMRAYIQSVLEEHVRELERKGVKLSLKTRGER